MQFIQLYLELQEDMLLLEAHDVVEVLEHRIMAVLPYADVIIHLDPVSAAD
tara:strand:- start:422 stop:574 length:153 start_codon:yes stop_codon:yes gene_type:complete